MSQLIVSIVLLILEILWSFCIRMIEGPELILIGLLAFPIFLYKKTNKKVWSLYCLWATVTLVASEIAIPILASNGKIVTDGKPLSCDIEVVKQLNGVIFVTSLLVYLFIFYVECLKVTVKSSREITNATELNSDYKIRRCHTVMAFVLFTTIVVALLSIPVYNLKGLLTNVGVQILIQVMVYAVWIIHNNATVTSRKVELLELEIPELNIDKQVNVSDLDNAEKSTEAES